MLCFALFRKLCGLCANVVPVYTITMFILKMFKYSAFKQVIQTTRIRAYSSTSGERFALVYKQHGDPTKVLKGSKSVLPSTLELDHEQVLVHMLAAPVNPADINMIQGVYPIKPQLPAVGGNEGVGRVVSVGESVTSVKVGDWVLPAASGSGTWQTAVISKAEDLLPIANDIPLVSAATLAVNPCTAYRMLKDFEDLKPGDVVIQNGGNSGVGQAVIQIAAEMGLVTINIVRNRPNLDELVSMLKGIGASHVVTDEFIRKPEMKELVHIHKPKLALNCVGGKASAELLKYLGRKGSMVTYGGMSKQPLMVPAGPLIFHDVKLRGYWMTQWSNENRENPQRKEMFDFLCDMIRNGKLKAQPVKHVPIESFEDAIAKAMEPFSTQKQLLVMHE